MAVKRDPMQRLVRQYLATGDLGRYGLDEIAPRAAAYVRSRTEKSSAEATELGKKFVRLTRNAPPGIKQLAHRALGWACLVASQFGRSYRKNCQLILPDCLLSYVSMGMRLGH